MGLLILGSVLSIIGILLLVSEISDQASCTQRVTARVFRMEKDAGSYWKGTYRYYPVFSYTVSGKDYVGKDKSSPTRNKNKYKVGGEVEVKCNPEKPEQFRTGAKGSTYLISAALLAIGITFIVCYFL